MLELNFKVIMKHPNNTREVRRFEFPGIVDDIQLGPFEQNILRLYPHLLGKERRFYWTDSDGDEVEIRTDAELCTALRAMPDLKKIYIDLNENEQERKDIKEIHHRITCDECGTTVAGFRYKCLQCPDYDLCENCESKRLHSNHIMLRIPKELPRKRFHHCWSKIYDSVDYIAKSLESGHHSHKDHTERGGRKCSGRYRRHCNWDDSDGGADCSKDKSEGGKCERSDESRDIPFGILFSSNGRTRSESCEAMQDIRRHSQDIEDAVLKTVKFFVGAVKDGFTPKTRSERGKNESSQKNAATETKEDSEKMKEGQEEMNKTNDEQKRKLSENYEPGMTAEPFPIPSAPKVETTERETETKKTENLYPTVPMDPKIEEALNGMLAMGFSNEGGTLQKIVEEMDGDIMKVLECIDSSLN